MQWIVFCRWRRGGKWKGMQEARGSSSADKRGTKRDIIIRGRPDRGGEDNASWETTTNHQLHPTRILQWANNLVAGYLFKLYSMCVQILKLKSGLKQIVNFNLERKGWRLKLGAGLFLRAVFCKRRQHTLLHRNWAKAGFLVFYGWWWVHCWWSSNKGKLSGFS